MADFTIRMTTTLPATRCFATLTDWDAHSAAIPLTTLRHEGSPRVGQRFVARTGVRRVGFDDVMVVVALRPPAGDEPGDESGVTEVRKEGRVIGGDVAWTVTPLAIGSLVEWRQHLTVGWLPDVLDPVVGFVGRAAYSSGLRRILASGIH
ncbi:MAG TPA: hypothetical protein PKN27_03225 [Propionibacteriaceae bacterium]|nr:hypothetical protein [Propionibacteriaceae bacterium]